jgi:hypothetical protein
VARIMTQGEVSGLHVVRVEARAMASEPVEKQAGATGVEGEPDSRRESRLVGGEEPTRGNTSSSKTM